MPGLLAAIPKNRFHFDSLSLMELGSVFPNPSPPQGEGRVGVETSGIEYRHIGLILAQRGKNVEGELNDRIRAAITGWAWERFGRSVKFQEASSSKDRPWEQPQRTAEIVMDGKPAGRLGAIDLALRRRMDEHLGAWSITWAELYLTQLAGVSRKPEKLGVIPSFPIVEMDFTLVVPRTKRYAEVTRKLGVFSHPLLKSMRFVGSYEDERPGGKRSLTFRCLLGDDTRTLADNDTAAYRDSFTKFVAESGYEIKKS